LKFFIIWELLFEVESVEEEFEMKNNYLEKLLY